MYELSGHINEVYVDFKNGSAVLNLSINEKQEALNCYDNFRNAEKLSIKIDKFREKRSQEANRYFWVLCGKLAAKTRQSKTDIYRHLIKDIGDNFDIFPVKTDRVDKVIEIWEKRGLGWVCEVVGESKHSGYTKVCFYYGSSVYDSRQMSCLIDSIIFECKEQGIQTLPPDEIERIKSLWSEQ